MQPTESGLRIAYVTPYDDGYHSVKAHTDRRIAEWGRLGARVEQFVVGGGGRSARGAVDNAIIDFRDRNRLSSAVAAFGPSVVYVRWLTPVPGLLAKLSRIAPVVIEVHSNDLRETAHGSIARNLYMGMFRRRELAVPDGATFVVRELAETPEYDLITDQRAVFLNGSWVERRASAPTGKPRVGIAVGAPNSWTALDRYKRLAETLADAATWVAVCQPHLVPEVESQVGDPVLVVAAADDREYLRELASWTVGLASLGLDRKGLRTAAPLKVRDYVGIGLPTVLPFWDEGVSPLGDPLILQLAGSDEQPVKEIEPGRIREFIKVAQGRNLDVATSQHVAGQHIESKRLEFLRQVSDARSGTHGYGR